MGFQSPNVKAPAGAKEFFRLSEAKFLIEPNPTARAVGYYRSLLHSFNCHLRKKVSASEPRLARITAPILSKLTAKCQENKTRFVAIFIRTIKGSKNSRLFFRKNFPAATMPARSAKDFYIRHVRRSGESARARPTG